MIRNNLRFAGLAILAVLLPAFSATPACATQKVYSPIVEGGEFAMEIRGHRNFDHRAEKNGGEKIKVEMEYGVTDRWMTALVGEWERENEDESRKFSATAWENIIQLFPQGKNWLDAGIYLEYEVPSDKEEADKVEFKLLLEKSLSRWVHTANLILDKEIGAKASSGTEFGYAWRSKWLWKRELELGFEVHGSFGEISNGGRLSEQIHQAGPVAYGRFHFGSGGDEIKYELGWLFGLTHATEAGSLKWLVEYETHF